MERRDTTRRAELVRWIAAEIVRNPGVRITVELVAEWVQIPCTAADRIIHHLSDAGLLQEIAAGVWIRVED
jgi:hypothetical protein